MSNAQLAMPGMPQPSYEVADLGRHDLRIGQEVLYLGRVSGGPKYGSRGLVKRVLGRKAVVDMGRSGTWRVPYYFLAVRLELQ